MKKKLLCLTELVLAVLLALFFSGCGTVDEIDLSAFNAKNNITETWTTDIRQADTTEPERLEPVETEEPEPVVPEATEEPEPVVPEATEEPEPVAPEVAEESEPVAPEELEAPITQGNSRNRLEEQLADPEIQDLVEQWNNDEFTVELLIENGDIIIYHFQLIEQMDLSDEKLRELVVATMESELDKVASTFYSILFFFREEFEIEELTLRIEYFNADGSEILTRIFE